MAHVQKRQRTNRNGTPGAVLWCLRYINPETGKERTETFRLKRDAERRLTEVEASKLTGSYVDPRAGQVSVRTWAERWLDVQVQLKPTTRARYRSILDVHVIPRWGDVELVRVRHADVQKWVAGLSAERSAATVRKVYRVLSQVLGSAVKDGRLVRNVAEGVALPRVQSKERRYLTHEQVAELADACAAVPVSKYSSTTAADRAAYRLLVLFLAYTGLRWGELAGLRVGRLDLMRRRASIVRRMSSWMAMSWRAIPRTTSAARFQCLGSSSMSLRPTSPERLVMRWCSAARKPARRCGRAPSSARSSTRLPRRLVSTA
jgi:integrase